MSLKEQIDGAMKDAMRAREKQRLGTIRLILAAIKQREKAGVDADPAASTLDGIPAALPALSRAHHLGNRAAAAGFDPHGTESLMALMGERLPQNKEYGYWRTHPFFDERVRAAGIRADLLKVQTPAGDEEYRRQTQSVLLEYRDRRPLEEESDLDLVKFAAQVPSAQAS